MAVLTVKNRVSTRLEKLEKLENRPYFDFRLEKLENSILSHPTNWKNWKKKNGPLVKIFFFKLKSINQILHINALSKLNM